MERLIAFGCSLTFGHGLPDCFTPPDHPGSKHSNLAWPSILAKYMNRKCINMSTPGSSNKRIWHNVINFDYQETDIVFILWSFTDRTAILHKTHISDIGHWVEGTYYNDYYDQHDAEIMSSLFVNHANLFLKSKNIKVYNLVFSKNDLSILNFHNYKVDYIPVYISKLKEKYPKALDNRHPGLECQEVFSKKILDYLSIENNLPEHKKINLFRRIFKEKQNAN